MPRRVGDRTPTASLHEMVKTLSVLYNCRCRAKHTECVTAADLVMLDQTFDVHMSSEATLSIYERHDHCCTASFSASPTDRMVALIRCTGVGMARTVGSVHASASPGSCDSSCLFLVANLPVALLVTVARLHRRAFPLIRHDEMKPACVL